MSRFIDADLIEYEPMCRAMGNGMYEDCETADKDQIDDIPTADVRENIKGEWIQDEIAEVLGVYLCSNCNIPTQIVDKSGNTHLSPFCPNCGADMRGEA